MGEPAGDSVTGIVADRSRRYRDELVESRPAPLRVRSLRAYRRRGAQDLELPVVPAPRAGFIPDAWVEDWLRALNLRNARFGSSARSAACRACSSSVGQLISIMTNFLPEEFRRELEGLQDAVPPRPYKDIEERIREELGKTPDELFAHFERRPIASASIGQVHIARMHDGNKVAVKVQYPDIEEIVHRDLNTLRRIFRIVEWFIPYQGLEELYREIRSIVVEELDYTAEANNAARIGANFEGRTDVAFPRVVAELSTQRVLVTHFEPGVKITDKAGRGQATRARARPARTPGRGDLLASRSSPTASTTRIPAIRGICWCGLRRAARRAIHRRSCSWISARSPRSRANVRGGIVELIQGRAHARYAPDRRRDEADGLRRARRANEQMFLSR